MDTVADGSPYLLTSRGARGTGVRVMHSTRRILIPLLSLAFTSNAASQEPQFVRDVLPVLTKAGCNSGACHGSFQGRGGFRLSLLGFDPLADHEALVLQARGRRITSAA